MIVTKENFPQFRKQVLEQMDKATLVTFDLEMTGISGEETEHGTDTPMERYQKIHMISGRYQIIQLGISVFSPS